MLHPSYTDLINAVNSGVEPGEEPVVQSRYSIVIATAKRARQLIAGEEPMVPHAYNKKPLSVAVEELYESKVKILSEEDAGEGESLSIQEGSGEDGGQAPGDVEAEVFGEEAMAQESQDEDETVKA
ncbi:MAG: DNA-directed RNA polymerase subunit omega [Hungatella sp.]|jgi:DNA-directed RNA polymerase subunit omega|nr:DNA-directed RNA polymerase subunit omega [Hungatella sp.]